MTLFPPPPVHFTCDVCAAGIRPGHDPRIHCFTCGNYDVCLPCHTHGRTAAPHEAWHMQHTYLPSALPPPAADTDTDAAYWGCMTTPQKRASPLFTRLANAIYTYIDLTTAPHQTTWLEPEKCSVVLDLLGYHPVENAFRSFANAGKGAAWADAEVAFVYAQYEWEHTLVCRGGAGGAAGMPLLSRDGFVAMLTGDALCDPGDFFVRFNLLLASIPALVDPATGTYFAGREVPRGAWPERPDEEAVWKGDVVQRARVKRATEQAAEEREGLAQQMEYMQDTYGSGFFDGKPQGGDGYWYYQQEFS